METSTHNPQNRESPSRSKSLTLPNVSGHLTHVARQYRMLWYPFHGERAVLCELYTSYLIVLFGNNPIANMSLEARPKLKEEQKRNLEEKPILDILVQNIENGTYLSWNGGLSSVEEYLHSSDLEHRDIENPYVRLILDRLNFFAPTDIRGIAGALTDAKTAMENAGVIIAKPRMTDLPEMQDRQRDVEQSELDSIEKEAAGLREILSNRNVSDDEVRVMVEERLRDFKPLANEVTVRGLTEYEYKRLFCVLAKNIFKANK